MRNPCSVRVFCHVSGISIERVFGSGIVLAGSEFRVNGSIGYQISSLPWLPTGWFVRSRQAKKFAREP